MSGFKHQLKAYLGEACIARLSLTDENELHFFYEKDWQQKGYALSPHLPLDNSAATNQFSIKVFFQNLFPEGENFDVLLQNFQLSRYNVFAITQTLGRDLSGALQVIPETSSLPDKSSFRPIESNEIVERLKHYNPRNLIIWDGKPRLSLAGIHQKINVVVNEEGMLGFGEGKLCSTHILKFERYSDQHLVVNEYLLMKLAKKVGLNVADVTLKYFEDFPTLLVTRFDRSWKKSIVQRRHLTDGCQALNLMPEYKYERNLGSQRDVKNIREGASLPALFDFCNACENPAIAKKQILEWVIFNLIVGNWDAHGKNISFFVSSSGIKVAPFYDLINIRVYPDFAQELAMGLGHEFDATAIHAYQFADFAESCGVSRAIVAKTLQQICDKIIEVLPELSKLITNSEQHKFTKKLIHDINENAAYLKVQAEMITEINL